MTRSRLFIFGTLAIGLLLSAIAFTTVALSAPGGRLAAAALGSGFTYQGELVEGGQAIDSVCDFQFSLWDASTAGSQVGATQTSEDISVVAGRFNAIVNSGNQFGNDAFNGKARWMEIAVRCPAASGPYTTLDPRQPLTATPYALFAARAAEVSWSGLVGIPAGFADNVDNNTTYSAGTGLELNSGEFALASSYQLPQACGNNEVPTWNGSSWLCGVAGGSSPLENVIIVAKSGGDFSSVQDALDSVTDAAPDNRYLIWVAPGVMDYPTRWREPATGDGRWSTQGFA